MVNEKVLLFACAITLIVSGPVSVPCQVMPAVTVSDKADRLQISVERMGGFAGLYERYDIYRDGRIGNGSGEYRKLDMKAAQGIIQDILSAAGSLAGVAAMSVCSDCYYYRLTYLDADKRWKSVFIYEGVPGKSEEEARIRQAIRTVIAAWQARNQ
jgi:hypothetical protein